MAHVTMIHGIGNKLPPDSLLDAWERALAVDDGLDLGTLGITSEMVYWADIMYAKPKEEAFEAVLDAPDIGDVVDLAAPGAGPGEREFLERFAIGLGLDEPASQDEATDSTELDDAGLERLPLPRIVKQQVLKTLLRDVSHYLFNAVHTPRPGLEFKVQDEIRQRMLQALERGRQESGPHVLISHSMGTVIAYDCLKRVPGCPPIDTLITVGSPLGRHEIPDELKPGWSLVDGYPEGVTTRWINVFDRLDPVVGVYPHLKFLYRRAGLETVVDVNEQNWGKWRHSISKYLHGPRLRAQVAEALDVARSR